MKKRSIACVTALSFLLGLFVGTDPRFIAAVNQLLRTLDYGAIPPIIQEEENEHERINT